MRIVFLGSILVLASLEPSAGRHALPVAAPNDNARPAGILRDGVLTLRLEVKEAMWYPGGDTLPGRAAAAFAEVGEDPLTPGPLVRVPAGTDVRFLVSNPRSGDTQTFHGPAALHGGSAAGTDSVIVPPGEQRELRVVGSAPGTYLYRARGNDALTRALGIKDLLAGAVVVDPPGPGPRPRDRVLMLTQLTDTIGAGGLPVIRRTIFAINGRSWPHTERLAATVGDSVRWRLINATIQPHPMHLHGFYFRVDQIAGPAEGEESRRSEGRMAVTHQMTPFSTASTTWVPERAGNWIFHCHFQIHVEPVDNAAAHRGHSTERPHALTGMRGLVVGIVVSPRPGDPAAAEPAARRRLRLVAVRDPGGTDSLPSMRYVLDGETGGDSRRGGPGISLPLVLTRAEPVEITVVNRLGEPTAVHWHGIELESYFDGVPGFSGSGARLSPLIAPADSFVARFTPPRAGTFMYHS
ncbi:MAG TPA: multicopper oxidase domain-containing protein, partial [Gemmatimonadales bacterium]|nr:multicopper oxidase domain-containing protein [Gemmatimonadales bacterium]